MRNDRKYNQLREVKITRNYTKYAEGSVLIEFGNTKVLCNASVEEKVPQFLHGKSQGWIHAEYNMLPRATHHRTQRDLVQGKINSRSQEISRLIGRSLRACIDLCKLGERQIIIDCDVIQADGGTRTASITGAYVALHDAINNLIERKLINNSPIKYQLAAVSVGIYNHETLLDLDYNEDSQCESDINVVMLDNLEIVEIQGTAEGLAFSRQELNNLLDLAEIGIKELLKKQTLALQS